MNRPAIRVPPRRIDAARGFVQFHFSPYRTVASTGLLLGLLLLSHLEISRPTPIIGELSPDHRYIARVTARGAFPYLRPRAYLQLVDTRTQAILAESRFRVGDDTQGLSDHIRGIRWRDNSVEFDLDDDFYTGPRVFVAPADPSR